MRLLHSKNLTFHEIFDQDIPKYPYAILSHRWGSLADEVSYEEFLARKKDESHGFRKISSFCDWASLNGYDWVWVDTCCIDKRSSAELSEAINSMFAWYRRSSICIVYLRDIHSTTESFAHDEWFSRGWTLQELIAPRVVHFVTSRWVSIGLKSEPRIAQALSLRTTIPSRVLLDQVDVKNVSVARRMSWMAQRTTTRVEDMAYCLLGIFDVNMPLLYGEGWKAFQRLQLLIMEQYEDESIFAWSEQSLHAADSAFHGLLAKQPSQFAKCANVVAMRIEHDANTQSLRANARNVEVCAGLLQATRAADDSHDVFLHQLRCAFTSNPASYLDVYVSDSVMGSEAIRPCFIALSRKAKGDPFSRVRARNLPWTLATHQESTLLARQPRQSFRARSSFSVEAIIDRMFSGNIHDVERRGVSENTATPPQTSAPPRFIRNGNIDGDHPPVDMEQYPASYYQSAPQDYSRYYPSPPYESPYDPYTPPPPPLPPRPNAQAAQTSPRAAVSANYPLPNAQSHSTTPLRPQPASYDLPPIVQQPQTVQYLSRPPNQVTPEPKETQWTAIRPGNMPYGSDYGMHMVNSNEISGDPRYGYNYLRTKANPFGTACKTECNREGCKSSKAVEMATKLQLSADEWHEYSARMLRAGVRI